MVEPIWEVALFGDRPYQAVLYPLQDDKFSLEAEDPYETVAIVLDRKHLKDLGQAIELALQRPDPKPVPCRVMETRTCPKSYRDAGCDDRPCARFESDNPIPWLGEVKDEQVKG